MYLYVYVMLLFFKCNFVKCVCFFVMVVVGWVLVCVPMLFVCLLLSAYVVSVEFVCVCCFLLFLVWGGVGA